MPDRLSHAPRGTSADPRSTVLSTFLAAIGVFFCITVTAAFSVITHVASPFVPAYRSTNRWEFFILLWWITCMQKETQLPRLAVLLFQGAFIAYGDCLCNADLVWILQVMFASGRLAMIDVASGRRLDVLIILSVSLGFYAIVPRIAPLLEKEPALLTRLKSRVRSFRAAWVQVEGNEREHSPVDVMKQEKMMKRMTKHAETGDDGVRKDATVVQDGPTTSAAVPPAPAATQKQEAKQPVSEKVGKLKKRRIDAWPGLSRSEELGLVDRKEYELPYVPIPVTHNFKRDLYRSKGITLPNLLFPKPRWKTPEFRLFQDFDLAPEHPIPLRV